MNQVKLTEEEKKEWEAIAESICEAENDPGYKATSVAVSIFATAVFVSVCLWDYRYQIKWWLKEHFKKK